MNNRYKLLVVNIDGTLLDKNGAISAEDKNALAKARDLGIHASLSTGRVVQSCLKIIDQLSLDGYHIFFDGALACDPQNNEEVYVEPLSPELVRQTIEFARQNGVNIEFYSATTYFAERETWASDIRHRIYGIQPTIVDFTNLWQTERIIKGTLTVYSPEEKAEAVSFNHQFRDRLSLSWTKTPACPDVDFINVVALDVSKGQALEALASHLGIALTDVIAIGDGANDISLLSKAGLAIAMDNASDELKAAADYVTLDVDHSGLAAAVNRFVLSV